MFLIGTYLFSGEPLEDYFAARRAEALEAAAGLADQDIAARGRDEVINDLHRRYSIPVTDMHSDQAYFSGERPMTAEECQAIGAREEDIDRFKAITISIPYSGDVHLFTCTPTIYSANQPQAEVRDGALHVTYFLSEPEEPQLENNFKRLIALIERTLEVTQWQAMTHNELLMKVLTEAFDARVA